LRVGALDYLRLVESARTLVCFDTESFGFNGDYGSVICASAKPYGEKPVTFKIEQAGNDQRVVREFKDFLEGFDVWVSYFGRGHDIPLVDTRLLKWGLPKMDKKPHLDLFFHVKSKLRLARKSQAHLAAWLKLPEQKMTVSPDVWAGFAGNFNSNLATIVKRCESDVTTLEQLYDQVKELVVDITR